MRVALYILLFLVAIGVAGLVVALSIPPRRPAPLASVENALDAVDFRDMPQLSHFTARDGTKLVYRAYHGDPSNIAILVHGSSGTSASMHAAARAIHERGLTVYALGMRGHDNTGRYGDIDYGGQLDDDLADFLKTLPSDARPVLLGFSSGGGFVLRIAGSPLARSFSRFVLISPQLPPGSPTMRPNAGGWVGVAVPRIIALSILSRFGIHAFEGLTTLAFAVPPENRNIQTDAYSFRMAQNFGPDTDYLDDLKRAPAPVVLLAGASDELFQADKFASTLKPARPDLEITLIPGLGHMDMIVKPVALDAIADAVAR